MAIRVSSLEPSLFGLESTMHCCSPSYRDIRNSLLRDKGSTTGDAAADSEFHLGGDPMRASGVISVDVRALIRCILQCALSASGTWSMARIGGYGQCN